MIITDRITIEDKAYIRTTSDEGMMIRKDGTEEMYSEAVDTEEAGFTYTETDIPIEPDPKPEDEITQKAAAFDFLTGRSTTDE